MLEIVEPVFAKGKGGVGGCVVERERIEQESCKKDKEGSFDNFFYGSRVECVVIFGECKCQCSPYNEKEKGEDQVGRCASMPCSMLEGWEYLAPGAGVVYQYHPGDCHPAQHIQCSVTVCYLLCHLIQVLKENFYF
ncbi:hypothetical protein SDC9_123865 [bioreactor metagenome]|uniref:Uncharacterized protein n=1 Tax=bioreactor metagenome TaxID=1076179 RepID=A0A645CIU0_9ZZZZ